MAEELSAAIELHRAGRLAEAAAGYEAVLAREPDDAEALHLLGVVRHQQGKHDDAVEKIGRAVALRPNVARYHANLAEAFRAMSRFDRAVGCCRTAIRLAPDYPEAHGNLGLALRGLGDDEAAEAAFRRAIELRPAFAAALNNLGTLLRERGRSDEALDAFRRAVDAEPNYPPARTNLGQLLLDHGAAEEAHPHAEAAARLQPDNAVFHHNVGNVLRRLGRWTDARAAYLEALRIDPDLAPSQAQLGLVLQREGRFDEALPWLTQATESDPANDDYWEWLAELYQDRDDYPRAIPCWERLVDRHPNRADFRSALGWALQESGRLAEAGEHYREALKLNPDAAGALLNLGGLFEELGDLAGAEAKFREALHVQPEFALPHARLGTLLRGRLPKDDLAALEARLEGPALGSGPRARLLFALAQVRDGQGLFAGAAECLREANALALDASRGRREYKPVEHDQLVDGMIIKFNRDYFDRVAGAGSTSRRPVFVFGLPRSGTTLIEQILAAHPRAYGAGELSFGRRLLEALPELLTRPGPPLECVAQLDATTIPGLAADYLSRLDAIDGGRVDPLIDKMPDNYLYLGLLATLFPNSTFIHCRRDLRDVAVSCWMTDFRSIRWANDFDHIAHRFHQYRRLMAHWGDVLPVPIHTVDYEQTVRNLQGTARRLIAASGLDWDPACLAFHTSRRPVRTASVTQVRQPVYTRSVERWRNYSAPLAALFAALPDSPARAIPEPG
jgi:tetratricopeptide (TPR) repeat protein